MQAKDTDKTTAKTRTFTEKEMGEITCLKELAMHEIENIYTKVIDELRALTNPPPLAELSTRLNCAIFYADDHKNGFKEFLSQLQWNCFQKKACSPDY